MVCLMAVELYDFGMGIVLWAHFQTDRPKEWAHTIMMERLFRKGFGNQEISLFDYD